MSHLLIPVTAHTLRADGFDASEDGTGRGTPLVPVMAFAQNQRDEVRTMEVAGALSAEPGSKQQTYLAFSCKDCGADASEIAPTLRAMGCSESRANGGGQVAIAFGGQMSSPQIDVELSQTLQAKNLQAVAINYAVRRLTPRECERLQGAADDWTLTFRPNGKPMADGPRYKMIGNSFAVPVIRWIGGKIEAAHNYEDMT